MTDNTTNKTARQHDDSDAVNAILWAWAPGGTETAEHCMLAKLAARALAAAGLLTVERDA